MYVVNGKLYQANDPTQVGTWNISSVAWDTTAEGYNLDLIKAQFGGKHISVIVNVNTDSADYAQLKFVTTAAGFTEASEGNRTFQLDCNASTGALTWNSSVNSTYLNNSTQPIGYYCVLASDGHNSTTVGETDTAEQSSDYDISLKATLSGSFTA